MAAMSIQEHKRQHDRIGVPKTDNDGNILGQVSHRVNTLSNLLLVKNAGNGEIAVSSDSDSLVVYREDKNTGDSVGIEYNIMHDQSPLLQLNGKFLQIPTGPPGTELLFNQVGLRDNNGIFDVSTGKYTLKPILKKDGTLGYPVIRFRLRLTLVSPPTDLLNFIVFIVDDNSTINVLSVDTTFETNRVILNSVIDMNNNVSKDKPFKLFISHNSASIVLTTINQMVLEFFNYR